MSYSININKQEAFRLLDAIESYLKDYELTEAATYSLKHIKKQLKKIVNS
jgi:hypothetical protein